MKNPIRIYQEELKTDLAALLCKNNIRAGRFADHSVYV
jgi:hypothetical protein